MSKNNIGFIGLGNVGSKIANNILKNKNNLFIHDLDKKKGLKLIKNGAVWSNNLEDLSKRSNIIITCLPSPKSVNHVMSNLIPFLNDKHLWIEMSTTDEEEMIRLSNLCHKKNIKILEAPVSGGQHRAESGNISILVSGKKKTFNKAFNLLSNIGHNILYCGKIGNASTLKIVTNYLASINLLSLGEALMVCKKYGLDLKTAYHGITISSGNSFVHETESQLILNGSYNVGFSMDLVCKDVGLFNKLTNKYNIKADISKLLNRKFKLGKKKYGGQAQSTSIIRLIEDSCNTKLRAKDFPKILIDNEEKKQGVEIKF
tara:strand:- start:27 stop:974 length:948 start_codon:yes stop_codon:yes gene_type:complete